MRTPTPSLRIAGTPLGRWVTRLLLLLVLPITLVTAQSVHAFADPSYGALVEKSYDYDMGTTANGGTCTMYGYLEMEGSAPGVYMELRCKANGMSLAPPQSGGAFEYARILLDGSSADGDVCEVGFAPFTMSGFSGFSGGGNGSAPEQYSSIQGEDPATCHISQACVEHYSGGWGDDKHWGVECMAFDLGALAPSTPTSCEYGSVGKPTVTYEYERNGNSNPAWWARVVFTHTPVGGDASKWSIYATLDRPTANGYTVPGTLLGDLYTKYQETSNGSWTTATVLFQLGAQNTQERANVVGFGVYRQESIVGQGSTNRRNAVLHVPQEPPGYGWGRQGVTNPGQCAWYWGDKIALTPEDDFDEPAGPIGETNPGTSEPPVVPPAEEPGDGGCDFSITNPSTWLSGGICALVGLIAQALGVLRSILGVLTGLVGALVSAIGNMLSALFIPGDGFFEGQWDSINDGLADTSFGEWNAVMGLATPTEAERAANRGIAPAAAASSSGTSLFGGLVNTGSGCEGPIIQWDQLNSIVPGSGDLKPLSACSGTAANLAQLCKILLSIFIGLTGSYKCFGMLAESVGASRNMYFMGRFDWTPHTLADGENAGYVKKM